MWNTKKLTVNWVCGKGLFVFLWPTWAILLGNTLMSVSLGPFILAYKKYSSILLRGGQKNNNNWLLASAHFPVLQTPHSSAIHFIVVKTIKLSFLMFLSSAIPSWQSSLQPAESGRPPVFLWLIPQQTTNYYMSFFQNNYFLTISICIYILYLLDSLKTSSYMVLCTLWVPN